MKTLSPNVSSAEALLREPQYRCCCQSVDVKRGTWVLAIWLAISLVFSFIFKIISYFTVEHKETWTINGTSSQFYSPEITLYSSLGSYVIQAIIVACLFIGLRKQQGGWLIPYLVLAILGIIFVVIFFIVIVVVIVVVVVQGVPDWIANIDTGDYSVITFSVGTLVALLVALSIAFIIGLLIQLWLTRVVYRCYQYFNELDNLNLRGEPNVVYYNAA